MTFKKSMPADCTGALSRSLDAGAQGINFEHGTWDEILAKAGRKDSFMMPTRWVRFAEDEWKKNFHRCPVAEFYNKNFIVPKIVKGRPCAVRALRRAGLSPHCCS
jgi:hypothetical protein